MPGLKLPNVENPPPWAGRGLFFWPRWHPRAQQVVCHRWESQMAGAMLLVGVGVMQVFPWVCQLGGDAASPWDCPWGSDRGLEVPLLILPLPRPSAGSDWRNLWSPYPASWVKRVPFWECPGGTTPCRWLQGFMVRLTQAGKWALPGCAQEWAGGGHTRPLNTGWGRHLAKCFSLRAKNGIGWLMRSVQAWQLTAGEQTCELRPSCHPWVCHQCLEGGNFSPRVWDLFSDCNAGFQFSFL